MKRQIRKCMLTVMVLLLLISFAGCAGLFDDSAIRAKTEDMLDALIADDAAAAYAMVADACSQTEFDGVYAGMRQMLSGATSYELKRVSFNFRTGNGETTTQAVYTMTANNGKAFAVQVAEATGYRGLAGFRITPKENTSLSYTGDLGHMQGADAAQWGVVILAGLTLVFVILVLIDCCRQKIKRKVLWILVILLGMVAFTFVTSSTSVRFNFNIGAFLSYSALLRYGDGSTALRIMIPLGAILYLCLRKKLRIVPVPVQEMPEDTATDDVPIAAPEEAIPADDPNTEKAE